MNPDLAIVLGLLVAAIAMFALNRPRMDAVALLMLVALPLTGAITTGDALAGFSDPNIVLLGALFVIGEGLVRTGVARRLGDWLIARAGSNENRLLVLLMAVVAGLGAFMSSTGSPTSASSFPDRSASAGQPGDTTPSTAPPVRGHRGGDAERSR